MVEGSTEVRFGSCALDLCQVAAGRLIVEGTGGIVTDYTGNEIDILKQTDGVYKVENILAAKNILNSCILG